MKRLLVVTELLRDITGWQPNRFGAPARVAFRAVEMSDYFPVPLSWRSFKLGASDYDITADEAYCPCGATARPAESGIDAVIGDFVDAAEEHIATMHAGARK